MSFRDRVRARQGVQADEDRVIQGFLDDARRSLENALSVCKRVQSARPDTRGASATEEALALADHKVRAATAQRNAAMLSAVLSQLSKVQNLKSRLAEDIDLLPEDVRAVMSRESLRNRVEQGSAMRAKAQEEAVANVLSSLSVGKR